MDIEESKSADFDPEFLDRARGCIIGAFVGDAAGAVLEFYGKDITAKDVERALTFPGGGCFRVKPGQFTDDSEMAMCLMHGLIEGTEGPVDQMAIAARYLDWYESPPFDIGITTRRAMNCINQMFKNKTSIEECL